jgi:hypothetical protein
MLDMAVTRYARFPLFVRHYPNQIADFALDLFLGKPALIVQHHGDFRYGYEEIEDFVRRLNRLADGITWCGLETIVRQAGLRRQAGNGAVEVKFYSHEGLLRNNDAIPRRFRLQCQAGERNGPALLTLQGRRLASRGGGDNRRIEVDVAAGESVGIRLDVPAAPETDAPYPGESLRYRVKVFMRRRLCEIRDNYVSRLRLRS